MNAMNTTKPRLSAMLAQVAFIAKVSKTSLGLRRLDKQASKQADLAHNAIAGAGKVSVSRLAGAEYRIKEINDVGNECGQDLEGMTTRWGPDGQRLMNNEMLPTWLATFTPKKARFDQLVNELIADAPDLIEEASRNVGTYQIKVPTLQEFEEAFSLTFEMVQIPDSDSFGASNVNSALEAEMKRHFEANIEAAFNNAQADALKRIAKPLGHLIERLTVFDKTEDEKARGVVSSSARLYESVLSNITDLGKVFRSFNLLNDPLLESVADRLEAFEGIDIEDVKTSDMLRKDLTKRADAILADLKDLI